MFDKILNKRVCVVGCGGTGCEILKIIVNFTQNIAIIDFDTVELTNLNRQFYFNENHIGRSKAETIGKILDLEYHNKKIEDFDSDFFDKFDCIFACLDNIESRMNLNFMLKQSKCKILVDLGVEGYKCHVKKVTKSSSCLYCIKDLFEVEKVEALCTISRATAVTNENRQKILKSTIFEYKNTKSNEEIAAIFNDKVTDNLLLTNVNEIEELVHIIIPNASFTNSICASLAIMLLNDNQNDFIFYDGSQKIYTAKQRIEPDENCIVCRNFN